MRVDPIAGRNDDALLADPADRATASANARLDEITNRGCPR